MEGNPLLWEARANHLFLASRPCSLIMNVSRVKTSFGPKSDKKSIFFAGEGPGRDSLQLWSEV